MRRACGTAWMAGTSPAMTPWRWKELQMAASLTHQAPKPLYQHLYVQVPAGDGVATVVIALSEGRLGSNQGCLRRLRM
jgi:hypothetical protein